MLIDKSEFHSLGLSSSPLQSFTPSTDTCLYFTFTNVNFCTVVHVRHHKGEMQSICVSWLRAPSHCCCNRMTDADVCCLFPPVVWPRPTWSWRWCATPTGSPVKPTKWYEPCLLVRTPVVQPWMMTTTIFSPSGHYEYCSKRGPEFFPINGKTKVHWRGVEGSSTGCPPPSIQLLIQMRLCVKLHRQVTGMCVFRPFRKRKSCFLWQAQRCCFIVCRSWRVLSPDRRSTKWKGEEVERCTLSVASARCCHLERMKRDFFFFQLICTWKFSCVLFPSSLFQHYCYTKGGMRHTSYTCICGTYEVHISPFIVFWICL